MGSLFFGIVIVFWIWAMVDVSRSWGRRKNAQPLWLLLIFIFPILGPIIYFQMVKNSRGGGRRKFAPKFKRAGIVNYDR